MQENGGAVNRAVVAADGNRVQVDGYVPALTSHDADAAEPLDAGRNCVGDGAIVVGDALLATVAHVHQIRQQGSAAGSGAADAGKSLDTRVPQQNRGLAIDEHHAVVHVVDQLFLEQ